MAVSHSSPQGLAWRSWLTVPVGGGHHSGRGYENDGYAGDSTVAHDGRKGGWNCHNSPKDASSSKGETTAVPRRPCSQGRRHHLSRDTIIPRGETTASLRAPASQELVVPGLSPQDASH